MKRILFSILLATSATAVGQEPTKSVSVNIVAAKQVAPEPDLARLEASRRVAERVMPKGYVTKILSGTMDQLMTGMVDQMMDVPLRDLVAKFGLEPEEVKKLGPGTTRELMEILDPAFSQRTELSTKAMFKVMGSIMTEMEPEMREGMAVAYANRFSVAELADLDRFFGSPVGAKYAEQSLTIMTDPDFQKRMQAMMPKILEAMPIIVKETTAATAGLPKPRTPDQLTKAERAKLAALFGIDESKLK
jgi:hypothetical protein